MKQSTLLHLLAELAATLDAPDGIGGAAIVHEAIAEIESLQRQLGAPAHCGIPDGTEIDADSPSLFDALETA